MNPAAKYIMIGYAMGVAFVLLAWALYSLISYLMRSRKETVEEIMARMDRDPEVLRIRAMSDPVGWMRTQEILDKACELLKEQEGKKA